MTGARTPAATLELSRSTREDGPALVLPMVGASREQRDDLRRALARLAALDAPHLSPLHGIAERPEGFSLTPAVVPGVVSWAELTARRPGTAAETVAVGLAVCQALGALHAAGLAHGGVRADRVLVSGAGIVELTGCGAAWTPGVRFAAVAADDVAALCTLLSIGIGRGDVGAELASLLALGAGPDPTRRPAVSALGLALEAWGTPSVPYPDLFTEGALTTEPVAEAAAPPETDDPAPLGASAPASRSRRRRTVGALRAILRRPWFRGAPDGRSIRRPTSPVLLTLAAVIGVGLLGRGVAGLVVVRHDQPAGTATMTSAPPGQGEPDWRATVVRLDAMRTAALAGGSAVRLAAAVDPDGPAYARDVATMTAREHAGLHLVGGETSVRSAVALQVGSDRAELEVVDTRAEFRLVGQAGQVVMVGPARSSLSWRVSLVRDGSGQPWRIHDAVRR